MPFWWLQMASETRAKVVQILVLFRKMLFVLCCRKVLHILHEHSSQICELFVTFPPAGIRDISLQSILCARWMSMFLLLIATFLQRFLLWPPCFSPFLFLQVATSVVFLSCFLSSVKNFSGKFKSYLKYLNNWFKVLSIDIAVDQWSQTLPWAYQCFICWIPWEIYWKQSFKN